MNVENPKPARAKIFMHGRSQAVRLPKEFRLPGAEVKVSHVGNGVLLEPLPRKDAVDGWLAKLQSMADGAFMPLGREQPPLPKSGPGFDDDDV
jgi:antitoxin VapB